MSKTIPKIFIMAILLLCFNTITIIAETEGIRYSIDKQYAETRGSIISTGMANIVDKGNGTIFLSLTTLAHESCDKIRHKGYLERWNERDQEWDMINSYDFSEILEDQPEGRLSYLINEVTITNQKKGDLYRLRGLHSVTLNGKTESLNTQTDGIVIK